MGLDKYKNVVDPMGQRLVNDKSCSGHMWSLCYITF
jgi:hypothetical protein